MGVREADEGKERIALPFACIKIVDGPVPDIGGRVQLFRDGSTVGLRAGKIMRQFIRRVMQRFPIGRVLPEPLAVVMLPMLVNPAGILSVTVTLFMAAPPWFTRVRV